MNRYFQKLESLLNFNQPLNELKKYLKTLPWDNENEIIVLKRIYVIKIPEKYTEGIFINGTKVNINQ